MLLGDGGTDVRTNGPNPRREGVTFWILSGTSVFKYFAIPGSFRQFKPSHCDNDYDSYDDVHTFAYITLYIYLCCTCVCACVLFKAPSRRTRPVSFQQGRRNGGEEKILWEWREVTEECQEFFCTQVRESGNVWKFCCRGKIVLLTTFLGHVGPVFRCIN